MNTQRLHPSRGLAPTAALLLLFACNADSTTIDSDADTGTTTHDPTTASDGTTTATSGSTDDSSTSSASTGLDDDPPASRCWFVDGVEICVQKEDSGFDPEGDLLAVVPPPPGGVPVEASLNLSGLVVDNQGGCGSCVAHAVDNAMALRSIADGSGQASFSPAHIWHIAGYGADDCEDGSYIGTVVDQNAELGLHTVSQATWPYSTLNPISSLNTVPDADVLESEGIAHVELAMKVESGSLSDIRNAIAQGWPVVIGVEVYDDQGWQQTGLIDVPGPGAEFIGYHAIAITGYSDLDQQFTFVNSWGTVWGNQGFGTMSYEYVQDHGHGGGRAIVQLAYNDCPGDACSGFCGDGMCSADETQESCCIDCGCDDPMSCQAGMCTCPAGMDACGDACVYLSSNPYNCGSCGSACAWNEVCTGGQCELDCGNLDECGGACVNFANNNTHCGGCWDSCGAQEQCVNGSCACKPTPNPTEVCDGLDNDCDGFIDEGNACIVCVPLPDVNLYQLANTMGDDEFDGNGPNVDVTVEVTRTASTITATTCAKMTETTPDWTTGFKCKSNVIPLANKAIVGDAFFQAKYTDTDHAWDNAKTEAYFLNDAPMVDLVQCIGDTNSGDVCAADPPSCSGCQVHLGCIEVQIPPS